MPYKPLSCVWGEKTLPLRYVICAISLCGVIVAYGQRVCIHIVITTMIDKNFTSTNPECPARNKSENAKPVEGGLQPWTHVQQQYILGCFYLGYIVFQVPIGVMSDKLGGRRIFGVGMIISTVLTAFFPLLVTYTPWQVVATGRVVSGFAQTVVYPCISTVYSKWIPPQERSVIGSLSFAANALGAACGNLVSGLIVGYLRNWQFSFYFWTGIGIVWLVIFYIFLYSEPRSHPRISEKELNFIEENVVQSSKNLKIPWVGLLTDMAIIAIIVSQCGHDYTIYTLMTNIPKYMSDVLNYDVKDNALFSSLPFLAQWAGSIIFGKLVDYYHTKKGVNLLLLRHICTFVGLTLPCVPILIGGFMKCNGLAFALLLAVSLCLKGAFYSGQKVNHLDLSTNFAGLIMGMSNGMGSAMGFISSYVIGQITPNNTLGEWMYIFWLIFALAAATNIFYLIFARATRAKWDVPEEELEEWTKEQDRIKAEKAAKKESKKQAKLNKMEDTTGKAKTGKT